MGLVSGIVVYLCTWWTVLFCTLPIGVTPHDESGLGTAGSAPVAPNLKFKFMLTSLISAIIWVVIYILIEMEVMNFFEIAEAMHNQDFKKQE